MSECFHSQHTLSLLAQLLANLWALCSKNKCGYQWAESVLQLNVPLWLRPVLTSKQRHFEAEMSPTLKLIREAAKQRLTVGGVWMKAESLPRGSSTTARLKSHSTSKLSRSSVVAARRLHHCLSRHYATSGLNTATRFRVRGESQPFNIQVSLSDDRFQQNLYSMLPRGWTL